jgi:hypothetical protein
MKATSADSSRLIHTILAHSSTGCSLFYCTLLHLSIFQSFISIGHIIDVAHGFDNIPMAKLPSEREDGSFLLIQKYEILDKMSAKVQSCSTGLNPIDYRYVTDDVKEVFVTDSLEWIHSNDIDGIAFVFHVNSIKDQTYPCNGMANAYFVCQ